MLLEGWSGPPERESPCKFLRQQTVVVSLAALLHQHRAHRVLDVRHRAKFLGAAARALVAVPVPASVRRDWELERVHPVSEQATRTDAVAILHHTSVRIPL